MLKYIQTSALNKEEVPRFVKNNSKLFKEGKISSLEDMKNFLLDALDEKKALDIKEFKLVQHNFIADYMLCASHTSQRAASSLAKYLTIIVKRYSDYSIRVEGSLTNWIVIDLSFIIVHIFTQEAREIYSIDSLIQEYWLK